MGRKSEGFKLKQRGGWWYVTWSENRKPLRRATGCRNREEAEKWRANFINEYDKPSEPEYYTVADCLSDYLREHAPHTNSLKTIEYHKTALEAILGDYLVSGITPSQIRNYSASRKKNGLSDGTIRRELATLSASFNHARKEGRIPAAPYVPMPSGSPPKERWLTRKEANRLLMAARTPHIKMFIALALYTGQRKGAILDLTWDRVDLKNRLIDFNPPGRKRTKKKRAVVPINDVLLKMLKAARGSRKITHVVHYRGRGKNGRLGDIKKGFMLACKDAKLKDVTPHTLRHTCGTWLAQAGVDMWRISSILGHSHSRTTELYLKHHPDFLRKSVELLAK